MGSIDWLRVFISALAVLQLLSIVVGAFMIGKPREPLSPATYGCSTMLGLLTFFALLLVWQALG